MRAERTLMGAHAMAGFASKEQAARQLQAVYCPACEVHYTRVRPANGPPSGSLPHVFCPRCRDSR